MRFRLVLSLTTLFMACFTIAVWSVPPLPESDRDDAGTRTRDQQARPTPIP
jgi:hypothetical protein